MQQLLHSQQRIIENNDDDLELQPLKTAGTLGLAYEQRNQAYWESEESFTILSAWRWLGFWQTGRFDLLVSYIDHHGESFV